jgi:hypothetical protein
MLESESDTIPAFRTPKILAGKTRTNDCLNCSKCSNTATPDQLWEGLGWDCLRAIKRSGRSPVSASGATQAGLPGWYSFVFGQRRGAFAARRLTFSSPREELFQAD